MQSIKSTDLRKYRTELPNLYDDAIQDPYNFRLLAHYVRVGITYESTRTTAKKCGMSVGQVSKKRKELQTKGWITLDFSDKGTILVTVVDRWAENFKKYQRSPGEQPRSPHEHQRSPGETKNNHIKKEEEERGIYTLWERVNGTLTPFDVDEIHALLVEWEKHRDAVGDHPNAAIIPVEAVTEAMRVTGQTAQRPNLKYVDRVLQGWMQYGFKNKPATLKKPHELTQEEAWAEAGYE